MELMKIEVISYICKENSYFSLSLSRDSEGYVGIEKCIHIVKAQPI